MKIWSVALLMAASVAVAQDMVIYQANPTYTQISPSGSGGMVLSRMSADPGFAVPGTAATPFSIGIAPPVQIAGETWDVVFLRLGLPYASNNNVYGIDLDLFGSETAGDFVGVQVSGFYNHVSHDVAGIQFSGILNRVDGDTFGIQLAGIANDFNGYFCGIQASLIANLGDLSPEFCGVQVSLYNESQFFQGVQLGLVDQAGDVNGVQLGLVNTAATVRGLQIGLVNTARSMEGFQIGLSNYIADSQLRWFPIVNACF